MLKFSQMLAKYSLSFLFTIFIVFPSFAIFFPILYLIRTIIKLSTLYNFSQFSKILTPSQSLLASAEESSKVQVETGQIYCVLNGKIEAERVVEILNERVLSIRNIFGEYLYPQLQQKIRKFRGYYFWEGVENFETKHYVSVWNSSGSLEVVTQEELKNIMAKIFKIPLLGASDQSPWKIYIVNNSRLASDPPGVGNKTVLIFYYHKVLGSEFTMTQILNSCFDNFQISTPPDLLHPSLKNELSDKPTCTNLSKNTQLKKYLRKTQKILKAAFFGPTMFIDSLLTFYKQDNFCKESEKWRGDVMGNCDISEFINLTTINSLCSIWGVGTEAVLVFLFKEGLKKFSKEHKIEPLENFYVGLSNYQLKLSNDPQANIEDVKNIEKNLQRRNNETSFVDLALDFIGLFPAISVFKIIQNRLRHFFKSTARFSYVQNFSEKQMMSNIEVVTIFNYERSTVGLKGPGVFCSSYGGNLQIVLGCDFSIVPPSMPLKDLNDFIQKELNNLLMFYAV